MCVVHLKKLLVMCYWLGTVVDPGNLNLGDNIFSDNSGSEGELCDLVMSAGITGWAFISSLMT